MELLEIERARVERERGRDERAPGERVVLGGDGRGKVAVVIEERDRAAVLGLRREGLLGRAARHGATSVAAVWTGSFLRTAAAAVQTRGTVSPP